MNRLFALCVRVFGGLQGNWLRLLTISGTGMILCIDLSADVLFGQAPTTRGSIRPSVLFIAIVDLRPELGCYGGPLAKSPNIDQFPDSARRCDWGYLQQAGCGPLRTSFLTGLLPDHTQGWHSRKRFRTTRPADVPLPQLCKQNGYRKRGIGKIFSGNEKELDPIAWSEPETLRSKASRNYVLPHNEGKEKMQAAYEVADVADDAYSDGKLADLSVKSVETLKKNGGPFVLSVGFFKSHLRFNASKTYWDLVGQKAFELPEEAHAAVRPSAKVALQAHREVGDYNGDPKNEDRDAEHSWVLRMGYCACVSYVDMQVGKMLHALKRLAFEQIPIVVICGDHGFTLGESSRRCKATKVKPDTEVALLIRTDHPANPGLATTALAEMVGLYSTQGDLAGLNLPKPTFQLLVFRSLG